MSVTDPTDKLKPNNTRPRYSEYEDTGIEWLKNIPKHWGTTKLKFVSTIEMGNSPESKYYNEDGDGPPFLQGNAEFGDRHPNPDRFCSEPDKVAGEGDLLLSIRAPVGEINVADREYGIGRGLCSIAPSGSLDQDYVYYSLFALRKQLRLLSTGSTYDSVSHKDVAGMKVILPPLSEQRAIATYLDRETKRIDALIEKKERLIDLLEEKRTTLISRIVTKGLDRDVEMQDSGVDWLGEIPAEWEVANLKHYADVLGRIGWRGYTRQDLQESGPLVLGASHITRTGGLDLSSTVHISREKYDESPRIKLRGGEVLLVKVGATIGKVAVVPGDLGEATINPNVMLVRPNKDDLTSEYLGYLLGSKGYSQTLKADSLAGAQDAITQTFAGYLPCLVPPLSIQRSIVNYLNREEPKIKSLIEKVEKGIERLKEYRTALISAAVTGQIDVRGEVEAAPVG